MNKGRILLPLILGLGLVVFLTFIAGRTAAVLGAGQDVDVMEMSLNSEGAAFEINPDPLGNLWISDYFAGEVWQVEPSSGAYTIYQGLSAPSDARADGQGNIWFADADFGRLAQVDISATEVNYWSLPEADFLIGTQLDPSGRIWVTDSFAPNLYRFDPAISQLCTYTVPLEGSSDYLATWEGTVWLGDWSNERILKLDPDQNQFTHWSLPIDSFPEGLAFDSDGNLWLANPNLAELDKLDPIEDRLTRYALPVGDLPQMIAVSGDRIWYTEHGLSSVGSLNPLIAAGTLMTPTVGIVDVVPVCSPQTPELTEAVTATPGLASWSTITYTTVVDSDGWFINQMPDGSFPWGVVGVGGDMWLVDTGRQTLVRLPQKTRVIACKEEDADGETETSDDRTPLEDWTIFLTVDGVRQMPGQLTKPDGCTTWNDLTPGTTYGVEEDVPAGWTALTPTEHDFGPAAAGASYSFTFVNAKVNDDEYFLYLPFITLVK